MWYYVKENKKTGPVSDAALAQLFKQGDVKSSTLVWTQGIKDWKPFNQMPYYAEINDIPQSSSLKQLVFATSFFRSALLGFAVVCVLNLLFMFTRLDFIWKYLDGAFNSAMQVNLIISEFTLGAQFLSTVFFVAFVIVLVTCSKWLKTITSNARTQNKTFPYSKRFAGWSIFTPFVNLIAPVKIVRETVVSGLTSLRKEYGVFDIALLTLWWFFTLLAIVIFIIDSFVLSVKGESDAIQARIIFSICANSIVLLATLMWIVEVSRVKSLQKRFFSNPKIKGKIHTGIPIA